MLVIYAHQYVGIQWLQAGFKDWYQVMLNFIRLCQFPKASEIFEKNNLRLQWFVKHIKYMLDAGTE